MSTPFLSRTVSWLVLIFSIAASAQTPARTLPHSMKLMLDGKEGDTVDLPPYGVAVALDTH